MKKRVKAILERVFLCAVLLLPLTSCENFLDSGAIKDEILEDIEIANSSAVTFYVEAEEDSGTVTPTQLRLKKKETFELRYKPASSWRFIKWEVRDRETKEIVPNVIKFDDETALETKGKVLAPREGLEIYAKAVIMPEVVSVIPDPGSTNNCYEPIVFTFNTPVDDSDETGNESVFNFNNILITNNGRNVSNFFEKPYFNEDKTVLTIIPKAKKIYDYLHDNNKTIFDIKVVLSDRIVMTQGDQEVELTQNSNTAFALHYRPVLETGVPSKIGDLIISRKQITKENVETFPASDKFFNLQALESPFPSSEQIKRNRVVNKIYIYGKFNDDNSGIAKVTVKEVREYTNKRDKTKPLEDTVRAPVTYTPDNAVFIHEGTITEFFIEHEVMTKTGGVKLDVSVYDTCDNYVTDSLYVIKVGSDSFEDLSLSNKTHAEFGAEDFNEKIKILEITSALQERYYAGYFADESEFKIYCSYSNKPASSGPDFVPFTRPGESHDETGWQYTLNVPSVGGLTFTITVADDVGNTIQKTMTIPSESTVLVLGEEYDQTQQKAYIFPSVVPSVNMRIEVFINDSESNNFQREDALTYVRYPAGNSSYLRSDREYRVIPYVTYDTSEYDYNLYGPVSSFRKNNDNNDTISDVVSLSSEPRVNIVPGQGTAEMLFTLAGDTWTKFDAIVYDEDIGPYSYPKNIIQRGTFLVKEDLSGNCGRLYDNDITLKIYGIKDGKRSSPIERTIITSTDAEGNPVTEGIYDIEPPETYTEERSSSNFFSFRFYNRTSNETDLDKLYIIERNGNERLYTNLTTNASGYSQTVNIPITTLEAEADLGGIWKIKATDKAGNATIIEYPKSVLKMLYKPTSLQKSGSQWTVNMRSHSITGMYLSTLTGTSWEETAIRARDISATSFGSGVAGLFSATENSFVKVSWIALQGAWECCEYSYGYFYTNETAASSGDFDYIEKKSDSEFFITSDAPTLVHTIKTKVPYNECKNWTEEDWEGHLASLNDKVYNFSASDHVPRKYQVPLTQINSGECYVVIAYFAKSENNKPQRLVPVISEVMVKP